MALPPPIPLRPTDRPETWAEYVQRREILALWRSIGDFVTGGQLSEFLFAPYRSSAVFEPYRKAPERRFVPLPVLLPYAPEPLTLEGVVIDRDQ